MSKQIEKKSQKKAALGRGLNSLLGGDAFEDTSSLDEIKFTAKTDSSLKEGFVSNEKPKTTTAVINKAEEIPETERIWTVAIEKIVQNADQPRKEFEKEHLESLAKSIKEKGIIQPITVRKLKDGRFEIIAGERRWRSAQLAGLHEVPVIIKESDDQQALEMALIENIQRQDLNPVEEAEAYFNMIKKYRLTQQELADKLGKERVTLANILRLLNLAPEVRDMVARKELSLGQAKVLLSVTDSGRQKQIAKKAWKNQLSVRAIEKMVIKEKEQTAIKSGLKQEEVLRISVVESLQEELQKMLGTKVSIDYKNAKGKIGINFYSDDELNQIVDKLRDTWNTK